MGFAKLLLYARDIDTGAAFICVHRHSLSHARIYLCPSVLISVSSRRPMRDVVPLPYDPPHGGSTIAPLQGLDPAAFPINGLKPIAVLCRPFRAFPAVGSIWKSFRSAYN